MSSSSSSDDDSQAEVAALFHKSAMKQKQQQQQQTKRRFSSTSPPKNVAVGGQEQSSSPTATGALAASKQSGADADTDKSQNDDDNEEEDDDDDDDVAVSSGRATKRRKNKKTNVDNRLASLAQKRAIRERQLKVKLQQNWNDSDDDDSSDDEHGGGRAALTKSIDKGRIAINVEVCQKIVKGWSCASIACGYGGKHLLKARSCAASTQLKACQTSVCTVQDNRTVTTTCFSLFGGKYSPEKRQGCVPNGWVHKQIDPKLVVSSFLVECSFTVCLCCNIGGGCLLSSWC